MGAAGSREDGTTDTPHCEGFFLSERILAATFMPHVERKKENRQPKGGMGGRHAATTQVLLPHRDFKERCVVR